MSAEDLGRRLLAEVEEIGLDELLNDLRLRDDGPISRFDLPPLDSILATIDQARASNGKTAPTTSPIVELMSLRPDVGTSNILYHLTALAVLPRNLGGRQSCVVIIGADNTFSIPRLAQQIKTLAFTNRSSDATTNTINDAIHTSLKHIHIFHPQSLPSAIATLNFLQSYLFNATRHSSFDRPVAFIALDSASSFYWQARSDADDAALLANTSETSQRTPQGYPHLTAALKNASRILHAPIIYTTRYTGSGPPKSNNSNTGFELGPRSFRPNLPQPWGTLPILRLVVRRMEVRKLPVGITVEQAQREDEARRKVVEKGKFEVFVNEWGVDEAVLRKLREKELDGFEVYVNKVGLQLAAPE
ncbi:hypothetical protein CLAFUW4_04423 [Fulvia fulva]|uniref:Uncharacterized protein n=1 Tax=Passalora fulva TaxID=5499 RepID=A0A9Q8LFG5_PASFU|nr:uncharacterized protein CLAFUR5_04386 [Fulvia fulva]KAK4627314.1 hypothetical protein CLAFUR4_04409 [Fulvia fulva]KAK4627766.1 hypothetical protein CLAFUR0_04411 [Fulvia fulva]UJO16505.1 hypothetical protein CLAFUR5_04386 [Fulvia fulva]WPV13516.1 hypothetical protein CLAFUW4_04423 [Fulvia fulva]WPV28673.1 hypothetical protein CLAFUW7_04413 [Fulvia fulva]